MAAGLVAASVVAPIAVAQANPDPARPTMVKHVWLIILENKSYDATFTGLNNNTYLWKTLPQQGVLLKNYFGTGHFSLDNYTSLVSGQGPNPDGQADCPQYKDAVGKVINDPHNPNVGQWASAAGPNGAVGTNGCVYPADVPTLFNQFDAAKVSWKGYLQDLQNDPGRDDYTCGAPGNPAGMGVVDPGGATATDQYVAKHSPFPWFHSILDTADCATKVSNLDNSSTGLFHDLQHESTTPQFSWISPNNCSDAHDAVCHGNNLSGGFNADGTPKPPVNYTGGLYASDLWLQHYIPMIEKSAAFKDGGLIDITFDEGFPPFTYTGNSFQNSTVIAPTAAASIAADSAGENLFGRNVNTEPTGANTPLKVDAAGNQLYPGPGYNAFIDRPGNVPGLVLGGGSAVPGARTDAGATGDPDSNTIVDNAAVITDQGRAVTGTNIPSGCVVGQVTDAGPQFPSVPTQTGGRAVNGSFSLVCNGVPTAPSGPVSGVTLAARTTSDDPLFDATHATTGGGDTGSVLISPLIKPGTSSSTYYNHYSWLRTMEDLFHVKSAAPGLDGQGHLGFAAQPGLAGFGNDVFNNQKGNHR